MQLWQIRIWSGRWTHVLVAHVFEEAQLSVGALGKELRLEGPVQLLDCHLVASAAVYCRAAGRTAWLANPPCHRQPPPAQPAAPPGERSPHCTIGTRAHRLQVLVHSAHLPGRFGHLLAVKALAGGWRGAHPRSEHRAPGPDPESGRSTRAPRVTAWQAGLRAAWPPASGAFPCGLFSWGCHPKLSVTNRQLSPYRSLWPAKWSLPAPLANRPPGSKHVIPRLPSGPCGNPRRPPGLGGKLGKRGRESCPIV